MTNFDWQTDEEQWPEEIATEQETRPSTNRNWFRLVVAVLLLATVVFLAFRAVEQQIENRENEIKIDVLSSHALISQAAAETDLLLFSSFLSGRDGRWTDVQNELVAQQLIGDLAPLGLAGPTGEEQVVEVSLSPDFTAAEVVISRTYETRSQVGVAEAVELRQTAVYRRGNDRWLFAPPDEEFWGARTTFRSPRLVVTYPQRDEATVRVLSLIIDSKLQTLCSDLPDLRCPVDRPTVWLTLSTDPSSLIHMADETAHPYEGASMSLPAPSLIGVPADETDQRALARGYAALVLRSVLTRLLDWQCCHHGLFARALVDFKLNRLGLQGWPMAPADYAGLLADWRPLFFEDGAWNEPVFDLTGSHNWQRAYAIVAFIASLNMGLPLIEMAQSLGTATYRQWLEQSIPATWTIIAVEEEWRRFVESHSQAGRIG